MFKVLLVLSISALLLPAVAVLLMFFAAVINFLFAGGCSATTTASNADRDSSLAQATFDIARDRL